MKENDLLRRSTHMDHLIIPLPGAVSEAAADADPALSTYVQRAPLGWWSLLGGPLLGVAALPAGALTAAGCAALGAATIFGLLVMGHTRHRKAVEADDRTRALRATIILVRDFNALTPRLEALIRHPPPDTAELFSEARRVRMQLQGLVGQTESAVRDQPRLGQLGTRRSTIQPLETTHTAAVEADIASLGSRLDELESLPPGVLRFPKRA